MQTYTCVHVHVHICTHIHAYIPTYIHTYRVMDHDQYSAHDAIGRVCIIYMCVCVFELASTSIHVHTTSPITYPHSTSIHTIISYP